ncbi:MAG: hypothetical protein RLZZ618_1962 [Pseudomonadota bacterium]|jgi:RimJ/RimL family protein N-acetyltransferase
MHTRRLTPADADAFQALRLKALIESPDAFGSSHEEEKDFPPAVIESRLAPRADRGVFGAFDGERLIGFVALGREDKLKLKHKAMVWGLYVAPAFRRHGLAGMLLGEALNLARSVSGLMQVNLSVNAANQGAIRLYASAGFVAFGREPGAMCIERVLHDELHMSVQLPVQPST